MKISVWTDATFVLRREEGIVLYVAYVEVTLAASMLKAYAYSIVGGIFDNNDAEHQALLWADRIVNDRFAVKEHVTYHSDSQFAVDKLGPFGTLFSEFKHVPRMQNRVSPYLVAVSNEMRNHFRHDKSGASTRMFGKTTWREV